MGGQKKNGESSAKRKLRKSTVTAIVLVVILAAIFIAIAMRPELKLGPFLIVYIMGGSWIWCLAVELEKAGEESKAFTARIHSLKLYYGSRNAPKPLSE